MPLTTCYTQAYASGGTGLDFTQHDCVPYDLTELIKAKKITFKRFSIHPDWAYKAFVTTCFFLIWC
jgi:hypothetical protein